MGDLSGPVLAALVQNCADTWIFGHGSLFLVRFTSLFLVYLIAAVFTLISYPPPPPAVVAAVWGGEATFKNSLRKERVSAHLVPPPDTASVKRERWLDGRLLTSNNC